VHDDDIGQGEKTEGPFGLQIPELVLPDFVIEHPMKYWDEPEFYINTKNELMQALLLHFNKLSLSEPLKKRLLDQGFVA
jgi:hypothetical protein